MPTIRCHIEITRPRDAVFALTQDYAARLLWDPFHRDYRLLDGETNGVGVRVWYRASNGLTMTVRYVSFDPPSRVAMTMIDGPWMFRQFSGAWIFKALDAARTDVGFHYNFELRGVLALGHRIAAARLERTMQARLEGLARYAIRTCS